MTTNLSKRAYYERIKNGADIYMVQTPVKDVVTCKMAFSGGVYATYDKQTLTLLLDDMLPGSIKKKKRSAVLESFEMLGAHLSVHSTNGNLVVTLTSRSSVFLEAFRLTFEVLTKPVFAQQEFAEAFARLENSFTHTHENTRIQANTALMQALYRKGHPHWVPSTAQLQKELRTVTCNDVAQFYTDTFSSVGALVCIVGDISPKKLIEPLREMIQEIPSHVSNRVPKLFVDRVQSTQEEDAIHTLKSKLSIDTLFAIPLTVTRDHSAFQALQVAVSILGASSSSRLFTKLRTEKNLTYGSYASLGGFGDGYPGYLSGIAIFPNDVFLKGRNALKETVQMFVNDGVTKKELEERKEEIAGKFKVGLSTTGGMCSALFGTLLDGKPLSHIDSYVEKVESLSLQEVNSAIKEHLNYGLLKTAAAGSVDTDGKPV